MELSTNADDYIKSSDQLVKCMEKIKIPCVFLNPDTNLCMVYDYRPIVCRYHGLGYLPVSDNTNDLYICKENVQGVTLSDLVNLDALGSDLVKLSLLKVKNIK